MMNRHSLLCCAYTNRLTVTDSDGAQNYTFADATVLKGCMYLQSDKLYVTYCSVFLSCH